TVRSPAVCEYSVTFLFLSASRPPTSALFPYTTLFRSDTGSFTQGVSVLIAAPGDHSNDGTHTITYYSTDKAGNVEVAHSTSVKIDTVKPASLASAPAAANGAFTVTYSDSDAAPRPLRWSRPIVGLGLMARLATRRMRVRATTTCIPARLMRLATWSRLRPRRMWW